MIFKIKIEAEPHNDGERNMITTNTDTVKDMIKRVNKALETSLAKNNFPPDTAWRETKKGETALASKNPKDALECFLRALAGSKDNNQRAVCLAHIGDYARRIIDDKFLAHEIFNIAQKLGDTSLITKSRITSMLAMTIAHGDCDTEDVEAAIELLENAITTAQCAQMQHPRNALEVEIFAFRRLAGIIYEHGDEEQKREFGFNRIQAFLNRLDPVKHAEEIARLNYACARCMVGVSEKTRPGAAGILMLAAEKIEPHSPADACHYYAMAGEWFHQENRLDKAWNCLEHAQKHLRDALYRNAGKPAVDQFAKLGLLLFSRE